MLRKLLIISLGFILIACNDYDDPMAQAESQLDILTRAVASDLETTIRILDVFEQASQTFTQGETIVMELTLTNLTADEKTITYLSGRGFDLNVINLNEEIVWRWSGGRLFTQALIDSEIAGNETFLILFEWDQVIQTTDTQVEILPTGDYTLEGYFNLTVGEIVSTTFTIN